MKASHNVLCTFCLLFFTTSLSATTIVVNPGGSIQSAIDSASKGDTVLVMDGTYTGTGNRDIRFNGKGIVVRSMNGAEFCIIDCEADPWANPYRGFIFDNGEDTLSQLEGFTIFHAAGDDLGGAIRIEQATPIIRNCIFDSCWADAGGAGVACLQTPYEGVNPRIENCIFRNGQTDYRGGGLLILSSSPSILDCVFESNGSPEGGAVYCEGASFVDPTGEARPVFSNCLFSRNRGAYIGGGAVIASGADATFLGCTFYANEAGQGGSALYLTKASATLQRSIIAFGHDGSGYDPVECDSLTRAPGFICCDVYGNDRGNWTGCLSMYQGINNNFSLDPMFCDTANNDFHVNPSSPCAPGNNACLGLVGAYDAVCGGAYTGPYWFVATYGNDTTGNGSMAAPFATIQHGIDIASVGDTVMVLPGTFSGPGNRDVDFKGKAVVVTSQFGPDSTTIECDSLRGFTFENNEDTLSVLSGLAIQHASEEAVWCDGSSPLIRDCIFADGIRGITCRDAASPRIRNCVFRNNEFPENYNQGGAGVGAGLYCIAGLDPGSGSNPVLDSCIFEDNRASAGAAIYCYQSSPVLRNCLFRHNGYPNFLTVGGAIFAGAGEGPLVVNCTFYDNVASTGSAMALQLDAHAVLQNCLLAYNQVVTDTNAVVRCQDASSVDMSCSDVFGNANGNFVGCLSGMEGVNGNFSADPIFCDTAGGDFGIRGHSPCVPHHPLNACDQFIGAYDVTCDGPVWIVATDGDDLTGTGTYQYPFATIQRGIDQCQAGDTVLLRVGTFSGQGNHQVSFGGKAIVVISEYGSDSTIVNVNLNAARAFEFTSGEDSLSILQGLTIRGANESAVYCDGASPTINNCRLCFNVAAIDLWNGSDAHIVDCRIDSNMVAGYNDATGVRCHFSSPFVERCWFEANASLSGGAVCASGISAQPVFGSCLFIRNGYQNFQTSHGAAVEAFNQSRPTLINCTMYGNQAVWGPAVHTQDADVELSYSIVAFNLEHAYPSEGPIQTLSPGDQVTMVCSDVFGNSGGDYIVHISGQQFLEDNFSSNPLFCDSASADFHLAANSLCRDSNSPRGLQVGALGHNCDTLANTPQGQQVAVSPTADVTVQFDNVTSEGTTDAIIQSGGPPLPGGLGVVPSDPATYYNISTTAEYSGLIEICIRYDESALTAPEDQLTLQHFDDTGWVDITTSLDMVNNVICGQTATLSPFAVTEPVSCCVGLTGNVNVDAGDSVDVADLTLLIDRLFISLAPLPCPEEANINGDPGGEVDIADLTWLIDYLFIAHTTPAPCQ